MVRGNKHKESDFRHVMTVAREAGALLMGCKGSAYQIKEGVGDKVRSGFTTSGDVLSLGHIVSNLLEEYPEDGIIAEGLDEEEVIEHLGFEIPTQEGIYPSKSGYFWAVDPLCGTIMHQRGFDDFVVSIGLVNEDLEILFGCVYCPGKDEMFSARKSRGAYLEKGNSMIPLRVAGTEGKFLKRDAMVSIEHGLVRTQPVVQEIVADIKRQRTAGTCGLELSYVADGRQDAMIKKKQPLYDYAGGLILVREAGGKITDWQGNDITMRLNYDKCTDLVCSNGRVHDEIVAYTSRFVQKQNVPDHFFGWEEKTRDMLVMQDRQREEMGYEKK